MVHSLSCQHKKLFEFGIGTETGKNVSVCLCVLCVQYFLCVCQFFLCVCLLLLIPNPSQCDRVFFSFSYYTASTPFSNCYFSTLGIIDRFLILFLTLLIKSTLWFFALTISSTGKTTSLLQVRFRLNFSKIFLNCYQHYPNNLVHNSSTNTKIGVTTTCK